MSDSIGSTDDASVRHVHNENDIASVMHTSLSDDPSPASPSDRPKKKKHMLMIFIVMGLLLVGIAATMRSATTPQEIRKQAAVTGPTLSLSPSGRLAVLDDSFPVTIALSTDADTVTGAEIDISYDPTAIEITGFTLGTAFPTTFVPETHGNGRLFTVLGNFPGFHGAGIVGTFQVKILAVKPSTIAFANTAKTTSLGKDGNTLAQATGLTMTVGTTHTPTPTGTPIVTRTPTPTTQPGNTNTPTPLASRTPTPQNTHTPTPNPTRTPTRLNTHTPTPNPTNTTTPIPTRTPTPNPTNTPTQAPASAGNTAPACTNISSDVTITSGIPRTVTISCSGNDAGGYINGAEFWFGDGTTQVVARNVGSPGTVTTSHTYTRTGVFTIECLTKDNDMILSPHTDVCRSTITINQNTPRPPYIAYNSPTPEVIDYVEPTRYVANTTIPDQGSSVTTPGYDVTAPTPTIIGSDYPLPIETEEPKNLNAFQRFIEAIRRFLQALFGI